MLQVTKIRKYKNNYNQTYGRITLTTNMVNSFFRDANRDTIDIVAQYNPEDDTITIKKLDVTYFDEEPAQSAE